MLAARYFIYFYIYSVLHTEFIVMLLGCKCNTAQNIANNIPYIILVPKY